MSGISFCTIAIPCALCIATKENDLIETVALIMAGKQSFPKINNATFWECMHSPSERKHFTRRAKRILVAIRKLGKEEK